jgi:hypothetical protein
MRGRPGEPPLTGFVPRVTILLIVGFALFMISAGLYSLPVMLEPAPPGATPDWHQERVREHLEGKVLWFFAGSFVAAALIGIRFGPRR